MIPLKIINFNCNLFIFLPLRVKGNYSLLIFSDLFCLVIEFNPSKINYFVADFQTAVFASYLLINLLFLADHNECFRF